MFSIVTSLLIPACLCLDFHLTKDTEIHLSKLSENLDKTQIDESIKTLKVEDNISSYLDIINQQSNSIELDILSLLSISFDISVNYSDVEIWINSVDEIYESKKRDLDFFLGNMSSIVEKASLRLKEIKNDIKSSVLTKYMKHDFEEAICKRESTIPIGLAIEPCWMNSYDELITFSNIILRAQLGLSLVVIDEYLLDASDCSTSRTQKQVQLRDVKKLGFQNDTGFSVWLTCCHESQGVSYIKTSCDPVWGVGIVGFEPKVDYSHGTFLHEIGHIMGADHPEHDLYDSVNYPIMSYKGVPNSELRYGSVSLASLCESVMTTKSSCVSFADDVDERDNLVLV